MAIHPYIQFFSPCDCRRAYPILIVLSTAPNRHHLHKVCFVLFCFVFWYLFDNFFMASISTQIHEYQEEELLSGTWNFTNLPHVVLSFYTFRLNIHIQILLTDLHTFSYSISWEKLLKDQSSFPFVIILLILISFLLDYDCIDVVRRNLMLVTLGS